MSSQAMTIGGCVVLEDFATSDLCTELLKRVNDYRASHAVPAIERLNGELPLKYSVIDGKRVAEDLPDVSHMYERVTRLVKKLWRGAIEPLADAKVACNINITQPGGSYRYHYDRNALTAILYLNATRGGETECYPNYRLALRGRSLHGRSVEQVAAQAPSHAQLLVDRLLQNRFVRCVAGRQLLVRPRPGRLLIMQGNRCLHSVRPVLGSADRINIVMSYDRPHARFDVAGDLNRYLYSAAETHTADPNYV